MPSSPAGSSRITRTRRPPAKYGDWDFSSELSGESNPSPMGRHLGGDSDEEEEEEEGSDSDSEDTSDSVEGGDNGEGGVDVFRDIVINDREGGVEEQEEAGSGGEIVPPDPLPVGQQHVRDEGNEAVLPPHPPPLPAAQQHELDDQPQLGGQAQGELIQPRVRPVIPGPERVI